MIQDGATTAKTADGLNFAWLGKGRFAESARLSKVAAESLPALTSGEKWGIVLGAFHREFKRSAATRLGLIHR